MIFLPYGASFSSLTVPYSNYHTTVTDPLLKFVGRFYSYKIVRAVTLRIPTWRKFFSLYLTRIWVLQLKVHKHDIFFEFFCRNRNLMVSGPVTRDFWKSDLIRLRYSTFKHFRVCSASDEIHSASAQPAMKFVPRMLSHRENVQTSKFWRKSKEKKRNFFRKFTKSI